VQGLGFQGLGFGSLPCEWHQGPLLLAPDAVVDDVTLRDGVGSRSEPGVGFRV
jgi:hypothetical protein